VLPDASTGQGPGSLARSPERSEGSRCKEGMAHFLPSFGHRSLGDGGPDTNFIEHYACRGSSLIGAENLSLVTELVAGTGAVSRYNLSWSQKSVTLQNLNCGQMSVSGCKNHYKFVLSAGTKVEERSDETPPRRAQKV
jgi:hypothetical protein